jgi:predicted NBD/HSP70 family sugar kinase
MDRMRRSPLIPHGARTGVGTRELAGQAIRPGADHNVMRELNRSLVLDVLRAQGPISRADIAKLTALGKPTVSAIVDELQLEGLVREVGVGAVSSSGGRPPILLEFDARSRFVAGVHLHAGHATIAVGDATGQEVIREVIHLPWGRPETVVSRIATAIESLVDSSGTPRERLAAIGLALPGLTDFRSGVCILAPSLGWRDVPARELLARELNLPIFVHHVGQAAAVAESMEGAAEGRDDVILLYVGSGIGAGILSGGRVFDGFGGIAGEIGHCRVPGGTDRCDCGKVGCLDTIAAAPALIRAVRRRIDQGQTSLLARRSGSRGITVADVAGAAAQGDRVALTSSAEIGRHLGLAASWLINLFSPALLVVAGELAGIGEPLIGPLWQAASELTLPSARERVGVRASRLGAEAEIRGAVLLALQRSQQSYRVVFQV